MSMKAEIYSMMEKIKQNNEAEQDEQKKEREATKERVNNYIKNFNPNKANYEIRD